MRSVPRHNPAIGGIVRLKLDVVGDDGMCLGDSMATVAEDLHLLVNQEVPVSLVRKIWNVGEDLMRDENDLSGILRIIEVLCDFSSH